MPVRSRSHEGSSTFHVLDDLDAALVEILRVFQRPGYRRRLLDALEVPIDIGALRVLRAVERNRDRPACVGDVADILTIDPSTASRLVDRCVEAGLLVRRPGELDRRRSELELTVDGRAQLARATRARHAVLADVTNDWPDSRIVEAVEVLEDLLDGFARVESHA